MSTREINNLLVRVFKMQSNFWNKILENNLVSKDHRLCNKRIE